MSLPASTNDPGLPQYRKPRADLYTMLLIVALIALILGCICLWAENAAYDWKFKGGPTVTKLEGERWKVKVAATTFFLSPSSFLLPPYISPGTDAQSPAATRPLRPCA